MDTIPFRLVPRTSQLLALSALSEGTRLSQTYTRLLARCGAADYVPHDTVLRHFRSMLSHPEAESVYGLKLLPGAMRLMLLAAERFPLEIASSRFEASTRQAYRDDRRWIIDNLIDRSAALGGDAGGGGALPAVGESLTDTHALWVVASLREGHVPALQKLLGVASKTATLANDGGGGDGKRIRLGQSMLDILSPLETILKAQPRSARKLLLQHVDIPHTIRTMSESLCSIQAQGTRSTDLCLCFLLTLLEEETLWELVPDARWAQIFQNLSLGAEGASVANDSHDNPADVDVGAASTSLYGDTVLSSAAAPFVSVFEASIVCPAILAVLSPSAPRIVREALLPVVQRDLMTLVTHLHSTSATLAISAQFVDYTNVDQRKTLCSLLDAQFAVLHADDEADSAAHPPTTTGSDHHQPQPLSLAMTRRRVPHPESYLLLRSLLACPDANDRSGLAVPTTALEKLLMQSAAGGGTRSRPSTTSEKKSFASVRCATGSDPVFLACSLAVALQRLGLAPIGATNGCVSTLEPVFQTLLDARDDGRLDAVLSARSASMFLTHPDIFLETPTTTALLHDIATCVVAHLGPDTCAGFTADQLNWIVHAQQTTGKRWPLSMDAVRTIQAAVGHTPVRHASPSAV